MDAQAGLHLCYSNATKFKCNKVRFSCLETHIILGQMKKISVFRVTGLKILGRVGTHIFFLLEKFYDFMHFERRFAFQNA